MSDLLLLDVTGRRRSPAATPGFLCGRVPHNKGLQYPPDPPRPEESVSSCARPAVTGTVCGSAA
jgi:hypothetical protein